MFQSKLFWFMDPEIVPGRTRGVTMGESSGKYYEGIFVIYYLTSFVPSLVRTNETYLRIRSNFFAIYDIIYILECSLLRRYESLWWKLFFFNGGFNSSSDGVCFERPARSRYQRSVPAPTYRRRARSFNWHANHSNFCPHNFVVISANSHSRTTDREHFDLC